VKLPADARQKGLGERQEQAQLGGSPRLAEGAQLLESPREPAEDDVGELVGAVPSEREPISRRYEPESERRIEQDDLALVEEPGEPTFLG
jgi:hypothetical protein